MTLDTFPILRMPRMSTASAMPVSTAPVAHVGMSKLAENAADIEFAWVMLPMPNDAATAKKAKRAAIVRPMNLFPMPFFMAYMGPPDISPTLFVSRYFTASTDSAYFVERPKAALIHIQTRAPGPPSTIAVATPTILPVPTVAASAVMSDWKGVMSPV